MRHPTAIHRTPRRPATAAAHSKALSTAARWQGSTVLSPRTASRARGRASSTYSSRRSPRRLFYRPASPVRNPAADPRPFLNATRAFLVVGLNCLFSMPSITAAPDFEGNCFDVEIRGPRAVARRGLRPRTCRRVGMRRPAAGFRPASSGPVASSCAPDAVRSTPCATHARSNPTCDERGWTPRRPPAGRSMRCREVPPGRVFGMPFA